MWMRTYVRTTTTAATRSPNAWSASGARASFVDAVRRGVIVSRPAAPPITSYLVSGRRRNRGNLKRRLIAAGLMERACESCGISEWLDKPLALALHHINGDG